MAWAFGAIALTSAVAGTTGIVSAMLGALAAVPLGEVLGRSRLRLPLVIGIHAGALVAVLLLGWLVTGFGLFPSLLGPGGALGLAVVLRFFGVALVLVSVLRSLAVRHPTFMAVELFLLAAAVSVMFATHRDGVIARPLWLSDWAWRNGYDPVDVLLVIGGAAVVVLGALLIAESRSRLSLASLLALPVLALIAILFLNVGGLTQPEGDHDLGLTEDAEGDEPNITPPGEAPGGRRPREDGGPDDGQGRERDGGGSSGGGRDAGADGGGSQGERDGGSSGGQVDSGVPSGGQGGGQSQDQGESDQPPPPASEQLEPSDTGRRSSAPMAVVLLEDDYSPENQAYYFRQDAWSEWNGHRLVATRRNDADHDIAESYPSYRTPVRAPPPQQGRTLVHARVALLTDHAQPFALESPVAFAPLHNPNPDRFTRAYRFESLAQSVSYRQLRGREAGDPAWSEELRAYYTQGSDDPRYGELARQIVGRLPASLREDPFTKALAVKLWLDRELTYSTQERHARAEDPTADMLFGNKIGYCVHFAHAAVLLWRSLGIPSRVGTGYHVPEDNRRGSVILIRSNDGHAWPELYLEGVGWVVLDISAARNLDPPGQPPDENLQELLGEMARENPPEPLEPEPDEPVVRNVGRAAWGLLLMALVSALVVLYLIKVWRRLIPWVEDTHHLPRVGYRAGLDRLSEVGLIREFGETREDFARRLESIVPAFGKMTAWNLAARFGAPASDLSCRGEFSPERWHEALRQMRGQLRGHTKLWRRLLGLLNPISFFYSR